MKNLKIVSVLGSPNKDENTMILLEEYLKGVKSTHPNVEISRIYISEEDIKVCTECKSCRKKLGRSCVIKDTVQTQLEEVEQSDIIIFATPAHSHEATEELRAFLNRCYRVNLQNLKANTKVVLLTTSKEQGINTEGENVSIKVKKLSEVLEWEFAQYYGAKSSMMISENQKILEEVYRLGSKL